ALLHPQETGHSPVRCAARALQCVLVAKQSREALLGIGALEHLAVHFERAAAAPPQEALAQPVAPALRVEVDLHRRRGRRIAPGQQVRDAPGGMALEEGRPDRADDRALAGAVRPHEEIEACVEAVDLHRIAKLPQRLDPQPLELHPRRSARSPARMSSASAATAVSSARPWGSSGQAGSSPAAGEGPARACAATGSPAWAAASRSSASTSPR